MILETKFNTSDIVFGLYNGKLSSGTILKCLYSSDFEDGTLYLVKWSNTYCWVPEEELSKNCDDIIPNSCRYKPGDFGYVLYFEEIITVKIIKIIVDVSKNVDIKYLVRDDNSEFELFEDEIFKTKFELINNTYNVFL